MAATKTYLTGVKPTGEPHLGNYLGAIKPALEAAREYDAFYFIADYHALTTVRDPEAMRHNIRSVAATWLAWPHNRASWPGKFEPIPSVWANLVRLLAAHEPVHIEAGRPEVMAEARRLVGGVPGVTLHDIRTNDAWTRDHGPTFLVGPPGAEPALVDWEYNAWGGKYPPFDADNAVPRQVAALLGRRRFAPVHRCTITSGYSTFSYAVSTGSRLKSWNTKPM